ncbi:MAG: alpha/beta hydrolase [Streptosporangiaceae bacterium]
MNEVISQDGTRIAFDRQGQGPALVIIGGGPTDRSANGELADLLSKSFTVYNYDRRGRGGSGDTAPFGVDREYEDLAAVIAAAGGPVTMYGTSGGGIIALEAAARGLAISRLVVWETPYILEGSREPVPADYLDRLIALDAEGRRGDMIELFLTAAVGMPSEFVAPMKGAPFWGAMEKVAHTLVYDAMITGDFSLPVDRLAAVRIPTLVVDGGTTPWLTLAAEAVGQAVPGAERRTLDGQPHNVDTATIVPVITEFLSA